MQEYLVLLMLLVVLFALELIYFRIAYNYKIIDKPNERSSHKKLTIRGGGVIFPIAVLVGWLLNFFPFPVFVGGLLFISFISFVDDINHVHSKVRFMFHFVAVASIIFTVPGSISWYWYGLILILMTGIINAWNFMDGINGITGGYSLTAVITFWFINHYVQTFTDSRLLLTVLIALVVFNYFNFRKKAICFAGDVGSVSIAFIICYLTVQLIFASHNLLYISLMLLYGLDTLTTIVFRAIRRENIFLAHRSHFYQFLANEQKLPHLVVASFYCGLQLLINFVIIYELSDESTFLQSGAELLVLIVVSIIAFLFIRFSLEGKKHLIG